MQGHFHLLGTHVASYFLLRSTLDQNRRRRMALLSQARPELGPETLTCPKVSNQRLAHTWQSLVLAKYRRSRGPTAQQPRTAAHADARTIDPSGPHIAVARIRSVASIPDRLFPCEVRDRRERHRQGSGMEPSVLPDGVSMQLPEGA